MKRVTRKNAVPMTTRLNPTQLDKTSLQVSEEYLKNDVDEVEHLAEDVLGGVYVVLMQVDVEVTDHHLQALLLHLIVHYGCVQLRHQHLHLAALPYLPNVARHVEQEGLQRGGEAAVKHTHIHTDLLLCMSV